MATTRDRFVRLAENRTLKAIKDIRLIGNLANRSNYSYTNEDVVKIFNALGAELKSSRKRFEEAASDSKEISFRL